MMRVFLLFSLACAVAEVLVERRLSRRAVVEDNAHIQEYVGGEEDTKAGAYLSQQELSKCSFQILMLDNRPLPTDIEGFGKKDKKGKDTWGNRLGQGYWAENAAINQAYALQHGYSFKYIHVAKDSKEWDPQWYKIFYLRDHIGKLVNEEEQGCNWLLFMDSDAFIREPDVKLESFISDLGEEYNIPKDVSLIVGQDHNIDLADYKTRMLSSWLNTGVMLVRASVASRGIMQAITQIGQDNRHLRKDFPHEQGALTGIFNDKTNELSKAVATIDITEMNSPWGRFAEHVWSGIARELTHSKRNALESKQELIRIQAETPAKFGELLKNARANSENWTLTL